MKYSFILLLCFSPALYGLFVTSIPVEISGVERAQPNPHIAMSRGGTAMAIWTEGLPLQVQTAYFTGSIWTLPVGLAFGSFPQVAIDANGNSVAVWLETRGNQIFSSNFSAATQTWSTPRQLSTGGVNASPQVAMNGSGNAVVIWVLGSQPQILGVTYNAATGAWLSIPVQLVAGNGSFPLVGLDDNNQGIVMWTDLNAHIQARTISVP